jgi:hypothetical protein
VPLYAYIQQKSDQQVMARVIAANNILNALFMVIASVIVMLVSWSIPVLFFAVGVMNLVVLALMLTLEAYA